MRVEVRPATRERWGDLVNLFEQKGPRGGQPVTTACWCMYWRLDYDEFRQGWGKGSTRGVLNRAKLQAIVDEGRVPGVLAYADGQPAGWCSIAPREEFIRLEMSRPLARIDDQPVWSVVCFYVHWRHKRQGLAMALLRAAVEYAASQGALTVEGYGSKPTDEDPYTGLESMFAAAGFSKLRETGRRSIWRLALTTDA